MIILIWFLQPPLPCLTGPAARVSLCLLSPGSCCPLASLDTSWAGHSLAAGHKARTLGSCSCHKLSLAWSGYNNSNSVQPRPNWICSPLLLCSPRFFRYSRLSSTTICLFSVILMMWELWARDNQWNLWTIWVSSFSGVFRFVDKVGKSGHSIISIKVLLS